MSNRFFNSHLAMGLRAMNIEKKILQISGESQRLAMKDVLEALKWIDTECDIAGKRIEGLQGKKNELERRKKQLLSNPSVHEVLIGSLTLDNLELSVRSYNSFRRAGYLSVSQICEKTGQGLQESQSGHVSKRDVSEIRKELARFGLTLKGEKVEPADAERSEDIDVNDLKAELERKFDGLFGSLDDADKD